MNIDKISKCLLCTYCVPGIGLSTREYSSEQKRHKPLPSWHSHSSAGRGTVNKSTVKIHQVVIQTERQQRIERWIWWPRAPPCVLDVLEQQASVAGAQWTASRTVGVGRRKEWSCRPQHSAFSSEVIGGFEHRSGCSGMGFTRQFLLVHCR